MGVSEDEGINMSQASPLRAQTEGLTRVPASGSPQPGPGLPSTLASSASHSQKKQAGRRDQRINPRQNPAPGGLCPQAAGLVAFWAWQPASAASGWFPCGFSGPGCFWAWLSSGWFPGPPGAALSSAFAHFTCQTVLQQPGHNRFSEWSLIKIQ